MDEQRERALSEIITFNTIIFTACFHGNGRSKLVARVLSEMGYEKTRVIGVRTLHQVDGGLLVDLLASPLIICANSDVRADLETFQDGKFTRGKIILDLKMTENDHAIASGYMKVEQLNDLKNRLKSQLLNLGFVISTNK